MRVINVVPSPELRHLVDQMVETAKHSSCADAVLQHLGRVPASDYAALVTVLLGAPRGIGRPLKPYVYTHAQRVEGHRLYAAGDHLDWVIAAEREYQRDHKRRARLRKAG